MDTKEFWIIIQKCKDQSSSKEHQETLLANELTAKTPDEIKSFWQLCFGLMDNAFSWILWGAAEVIMGHCSDEDFYDFRCWVIMQGEHNYYEILKNPDVLADFPAPLLSDFESPFSSRLLDIVMDVYESKTGSLPEPPIKRHCSDQPTGQPVSFEDHEVLEKTYPNLYKKYYE